MMYTVTKYDENGNRKDYGLMNADDMKLLTRGYKQDEDLPEMYNRKNSKSFFTVCEVDA